MSAPTVVRRLGCATTYTAHVWQWDRLHQRMRYYMPVTGLIEITWERVLNSASQATVKFAPTDGDDCCSKLAPIIRPDGTVAQTGVWPWAHELAIYRDGDLVWQGPITQIDENVLPDETTDSVQITAKDFLAWLDVRLIHGDYINLPAQPVTQLARTLLMDAFAYDNPNIQEHMQIIGTGESQPYSVRMWEAVCGDELHRLGAIGLDYTCVGRIILARPPERDTTQTTLMLHTRDFQTGVAITVAGSLAATGSAAIGGQPTTPPAGVDPANVPPVKVYWPSGGPIAAVDPFFGQIEHMTVDSTYTDPGVLTTIAKQFVLDGNPPPTTVTIPPDSRLDPAAAVSVHDLVPSTYFLVTVAGTCRQIQQYMRLSHVTASWSNGEDEQIAVTFIPGATPATRDQQEGEPV